MMRYQAIYDIAEICFLKGIRNIVLCPGSRCAPLTIGFTRHPSLDVKTISDERSAAFIALGIAQASRKPVALICTSGTAAYNFAPAVAEAFFNNVPLLIITADRPAEWIAQHDGQTIFQDNLYGRHVKKFFSLPQDYSHPDDIWNINRIVNEAINIADDLSPGPVHINAPFREPLYPAKGETFDYSQGLRIIHQTLPSDELSKALRLKIENEWHEFNRVLIVCGQHRLDHELTDALTNFRSTHQIPVIADIISNLHGLDGVISHADLFLGQASADIKKSLQPDLVISIGDSSISKNVKLFLRSLGSAKHWHIQSGNALTDPFKNVTDIFNCSATKFFQFLAEIERPATFQLQKQTNYNNLWEIEQRRIERVLENFFKNEELSELEVVRELLNQIPDHSSLHLANSMSVRYANFFGLKKEKSNVEVFSNRGTSGIDGCTSTAVGHYFSTQKPTYLITGDVAFFYDRNAFWHNYSIEGLRILLLNNHGGLIFNMIDGPASLPEGPEFFVTRQGLSSKHISEEFKLTRITLDHRRKFKNVFADFNSPDKDCKILEFESGVTLNKRVFDELKMQIKNSYDH